MRVIVLWAVLAGCLFIYGFLMAEPIRITTQDGRTKADLTVVITLPHVTEAYRSLAVFVCAADMDDRNQMFCNEAYDRSSQQDIRQDQRQYPFQYHSVPRGWIQISAIVMDAQTKTIAAGQTRVIR